VAAAERLWAVDDGATTVATVLASCKEAKRPGDKLAVLATGLVPTVVALGDTGGLVDGLTERSVRGSSDSSLSETDRWRALLE